MGTFYIDLLYGKVAFPIFLFLSPFFAHFNFFSRLYGAIQKSRFSKKKSPPFIENSHVDTSEFLDPVNSYHSFNDFFIRKLKPEFRPITPEQISRFFLLTAAIWCMKISKKPTAFSLRTRNFPSKISSEALSLLKNTLKDRW